MTAYRIVEWNKHFENNRSRQIEDVRWVAVPNRHDGEGYSLVMRHEHASELFSAWVLIVQVASKCHPRGTMIRDNGTPLDAEALALKTRAPVAWFTLALQFLSSPEIGWLETFETEDIATERHPGVTRTSPGRQEGVIEGKEGRKERRERKKGGKGDASPSFSETAAELGMITGKEAEDQTDTMKHASAVLAFLNQTTSKQFDAVPAILDVIKNRLREGATVEDCQFAIRHCHGEWSKDAKMSAYVRPSTIFGAKFHEYKEAGRRKYARRAQAQQPKKFRSEIERLEHEFVAIRDKVEAARTEAQWTGNTFRENRATLAKEYLVKAEPLLAAAQQALEVARGASAKPEVKV